MKNSLLTPIVDYYQNKRPSSWKKIFNRKAPLEVEIGFGLGEVLIREAVRNPKRNYIGIEQHWQRIFKALRTIEKVRQKEDLDNICVLNIDARDAFYRLFEQKSIDHIYCLFPCPWPKQKHVKHRLFSAEFLKFLNSRLKEKGVLKIVTDAYPFVQWIEEEIHDGIGFKIETDKINPEFDTKFERKWKDEGRKDYYQINFRKIKHINIPVVEDCQLKSFKNKDFNPKNFKFTNVKGAPSIIFKEIVFDEDNERALVRLIVSEEHLNQNIWISITKKDTYWRVYKTDGQQFFPTPGINKAIEGVYDAVVKSAQ